MDLRQVAAAAQSAIEGTAGTSSIVSSTGNKQSAAAISGSSLNTAGTGRTTLTPPAGAAAAWRGVLWGRIESMCEVLQRTILQVRSM